MRAAFAAARTRCGPSPRTLRSAIGRLPQADAWTARRCGADLVRRGLVFLRSEPRRLHLVRGGEHCSLDPACPRRRWNIRVLDATSMTAVAAGGESPQSLERGRRRYGRGVAPVKDNRRLVLRRRGRVDRGSATRAAGDLSGQALGLIPLLGGGRARSFDVVQMKAPDVGELRRLVRSASPTRVVAHKHADTLASMTSDNVRRRVAAAKTGTLCPNGPHLKN